MPVQTGVERFVQFRYEPSYLNDAKYHPVRSNPKEVCEANGLHPLYSNINLDGGNIVHWSDRAIITDRVFDENPEYTNKARLIAELENLLEVEIIIIPQINCDLTGHADGLVRFVDRNTLLGNDREKEYKYWKKKMNRVLKEHGMEYIDIPFFEYRDRNHRDNAIGIYVNYLEIKDLIILPIFETEGNKDAEVVEQFGKIFSKRNRKIETISYNPVGLEGGLLNCTTWTIRE
jgi:agmatine deiminase